jgi:hypothetical protein
MTVLFLLLCVARAAEPPPPTVDVAEEADLLFRRGVAAYRDRRIEDALIDLLASNRLVPNRNAMFNAARCYEQLGNPAAAWKWYTAYAAAETDPTARAEAEAALARLAPTVARIEVTSVPPGATVYVDRRDLGIRGVTPVTLALPEGEHQLLFSLEGHADAVTVGTTRVGTSTQTSVRLVPFDPKATGWSWTEVRVGSRLLVRVQPGVCQVLPDERVPAIAVTRVAPPSGPPPSHPRPPGATHTAVTMVVASAGRVGESVLALDPADASAAVAGASDLGRWALDRCAIADTGALAVALARLPDDERPAATALFAHWAAARGNDADAAALSCLVGECGPLAALLSP